MIHTFELLILETPAYYKALSHCINMFYQLLSLCYQEMCLVYIFHSCQRFYFILEMSGEGNTNTYYVQASGRPQIFILDINLYTPASQLVPLVAVQFGESKIIHVN